MRATKAPPTPEPESTAELRHYTPEELVDPEGEIRLPTTARMLRKWAHQRLIPHNQLGKRVSFLPADIRAIQAMFAVAPISETKPASARKRAA